MRVIVPARLIGLLTAGKGPKPRNVLGVCKSPEMIAPSRLAKRHAYESFLYHDYNSGRGILVKRGQRAAWFVILGHDWGAHLFVANPIAAT
jgi:hypothetical protein